MGSALAAFLLWKRVTGLHACRRVLQLVLLWHQLQHFAYGDSFSCRRRKQRAKGQLEISTWSVTKKNRFDAHDQITRCPSAFLDEYWRDELLPPSSLRVNRPIWGKSLKVSRQMTPAARSLAMHTWSCLTNRGRVLLFSPVFLSTRQIKACRWDLQRFQLQIQRVQSVAVAATYNSYNKKRVKYIDERLTVICTSSMQVWIWRTAL